MLLISPLYQAKATMQAKPCMPSASELASNNFMTQADVLHITMHGEAGHRVDYMPELKQQYTYVAEAFPSLRAASTIPNTVLHCAWCMASCTDDKTHISSESMA